RLPALPAGGPPALRRAARGGSGGARTVARGAGPPDGRGRRPVVAGTAARSDRGADGATDARTPLQHAADFERRPALRRGGGAGRRPRSRQLRGAGGDGVGVAGDRRRAGRELSVRRGGDGGG